ncbi:intracellular multiplication protein IcmE [Piscirickettsia salmonis]|uniref:Type IV secretion system protein IcmE n=1 Tax=Piscirickettsia salmonis TaxID=1238 RepID=A0A1L6TAZ2_PISSA|nr:TrbI/VirB10 family protein [Piscirickettsia salmonis]AKP73672.1 conjugal transfer protein TrbI [Piscirickettsia salmonis LF-89 = ATCC VR-1361]ALB22460.1 type IV secretion system protein IcmE [Piscirickettsia salmonis]AMA42043.1 conjugal transfer protein TrbI [Piscirickettsia salmonis]AOS34511.1 conjugal transfer protein TrbI [Piscirickettsia salmonis]APS59232.1 conjugal transfer protein TrbI [Piscirickettsia salmonis]
MKLKAITKTKEFLSEHPRLRVLIIFAIIMLVIIFIVNNLSQPKSAEEVGGSYVASPNGAMSQKTTKYTNTTYKKIHKANEDEEVNRAENQGKTLVASSTQDISPRAPGAPELSQADRRIQELTGSHIFKEMVQREAIQKNHQNLQEEKEQQEVDQYQLKVSEKENKMQNKIQGILAKWENVSAQKVMVAKVSTVNNAGDNGQSGKNNNENIIEKAGAIVFAVLDTQLNSDQPGTPVMATIVQGKFKNAKLLGSFKREDEKLVISFDRISLPELDHSISIKAYAINATTAQNALSSDVDNHYLLRYGGLFAAAFLQGFGDYFSQNSSSLCGGATTCIITGTQSTAEQNRTTRKALYSGLGQVGTTLAGKASAAFDRPPTVTLNQGVGMGILFMSDVKV